MSRADRIGIGLGLLCWAPTILLWFATVAAIKGRFAAEMAVVDLLFLIRRDRTARRVLAGSIRQNRRAMRAGQRRARATRQRRW